MPSSISNWTRSSAPSTWKPGIDICGNGHDARSPSPRTTSVTSMRPSAPTFVDAALASSCSTPIAPQNDAGRPACGTSSTAQRNGEPTTSQSMRSTGTRPFTKSSRNCVAAANRTRGASSSTRPARRGAILRENASTPNVRPSSTTSARTSASTTRSLTTMREREPPLRGASGKADAASPPSSHIAFTCNGTSSCRWNNGAACSWKNARSNRTSTRTTAASPTKRRSRPPSTRTETAPCARCATDCESCAATPATNASNAANRRAAFTSRAPRRHDAARAASGAVAASRGPSAPASRTCCRAALA